MLQYFIMNLVINLFKSYIESTSSKADDKVLDMVKEGAIYLSNKDNNDITVTIANEILATKIKG